MPPLAADRESKLSNLVSVSTVAGIVVFLLGFAIKNDTAVIVGLVWIVVNVPLLHLGLRLVERIALCLCGHCYEPEIPRSDLAPRRPRAIQVEGGRPGRRRADTDHDQIEGAGEEVSISILHSHRPLQPGAGGAYDGVNSAEDPGFELDVRRVRYLTDLPDVIGVTIVLYLSFSEACTTTRTCTWMKVLVDERMAGKYNTLVIPESVLRNTSRFLRKFLARVGTRCPKVQSFHEWNARQERILYVRKERSFESGEDVEGAVIESTQELQFVLHVMEGVLTVKLLSTLPFASHLRSLSLRAPEQGSLQRLASAFKHDFASAFPRLQQLTVRVDHEDNNVGANLLPWSHVDALILHVERETIFQRQLVDDLSCVENLKEFKLTTSGVNFLSEEEPHRALSDFLELIPHSVTTLELKFDRVYEMTRLLKICEQVVVSCRADVSRMRRMEIIAQKKAPRYGSHYSMRLRILNDTSER